jgi:xeroderma pigmentosum group C-complementing protein
MKWVKQRASTVSRRREIEMMLERGREERDRAGEPSSGVGEEEVMQGLYAESQTELYKPDPIVDVRCTFGSSHIQ